MQFDLLTFGLRDFICSHIKACLEREMHLQLGLIWSGLATRPKSSAFVLVEATMEVDGKKPHKWTFATRLFSLFLKQSFSFKDNIL